MGACFRQRTSAAAGCCVTGRSARKAEQLGKLPLPSCLANLAFELTPLVHAGKKRALLGTLLRRYLKPGGSGIFLLDIHCYDPPEWCAPAHSRARPFAWLPSPAAAPAHRPASQDFALAHSPSTCVPRSLLVADTDQIAKGRRTGVRCTPSAACLWLPAKANTTL